MTLRWVSTDLASGDIIDDLPALLPQYPLRQSIGQYETASAELVMGGAHPGWERSVQTMASVLHVYDDDDPLMIPQWSGIVTKQDRSDGGVSLSLATAEYYLDCRDVGNWTVTEGQNKLIADMIDRYINSLTGINLQVSYDEDGKTRTREYHITDRASVYDRMTELSDVAGGPEWSISWAWRPSGDGMVPTLRVADRLGSSPVEGLYPSAGFTSPGNLTSWRLTEDYTTGQGANRVIAFGTGEGDKQPRSDPHTAADMEGRPTIDYLWSPSTSITSKPVLDAHAKAKLQALQRGTIGLTLTANLGAKGTPRFGHDWILGDDIYYALGGHDERGHDLIPALPGGVTGTARALGSEVGDATISPIVVLDGPPRRIDTGTVAGINSGGAAGLHKRLSAELPGRLVDGGTA